MMQTRMLKFRLYPNKAQRQTLEQTLEDCRCIYNQLLAIHRSVYKETGKTVSQYDLNRKLTELKSTTSSLSNVHSQVLQNISKRIRDAYHGFFVRRKLGRKAGLPRFRKYGRYKSITYPQSGFKIEGKKLCLSKTGRINIKLHRPMRGIVKTLTIKRMPSGKWFAIFSCKIAAESGKKSNGSVGIDVGLHHYAILSDGQVIENPRHLRKSERKLARLQRSFSRKRKRSRNWEKTRIKVARCHEKVFNQRTDFLHKTTKKLVDSYSTIVVEDLRILNMLKNHRLAKSIADASWGWFIRMLSYKEEESGGKVVKVNPKGTTQMCSRCGFKVPKTLSDRIHACPRCGLKMDRDLNASRNILLKIPQELREFTPVEIRPLLPVKRASPIEEAGSHPYL